MAWAVQVEVGIHEEAEVEDDQLPKIFFFLWVSSYMHSDGVFHFFQTKNLTPPRPRPPIVSPYHPIQSYLHVYSWVWGRVGSLLPFPFHSSPPPPTRIKILPLGDFMRIGMGWDGVRGGGGGSRK